MKREVTKRLSLVTAIAALGMIVGAHAGDLDPPAGPIVPTMKTLDQVEPRIPISSVPFVITEPGSYYLTKDLTSAVSPAFDVRASNVSIDLGERTLVGIDLPGPLIEAISDAEGLMFMNGNMVGGGLSTQNSIGTRIIGLTISTSTVAIACGDDAKVVGCVVSHDPDNPRGAAPGIQVGNNSLVSECSVDGVGGVGIIAGASSLVQNCLVSANGGHGIEVGAGSSVKGCTASANGVDGIHIGEGSTINACSARANSGDGIATSDGCTVIGCTTSENYNGIVTGQGAAVTECVANSNAARGFSAGTGTTVSACSAMFNQQGFYLVSGCTARRCTAGNNTQGGIFTTGACTISACTARENGGPGIRALNGDSITGCAVFANHGDGIEASSGCHIVNNACKLNGFYVGDAAGIHALAGGNRIDGNTVTDNDRGLDIDAAGNTVANNSVNANTDNYDIADGNQLNILLSAIPESIDWPATVTLAGSLTHPGTGDLNGITVNADNVTIDLGGHALIGVAGTGDGIAVPAAQRNLTVVNGTVRDWGADGVDALNAENSRLERLQSSNNVRDGLRIGAGSTVRACLAQMNTSGDGIQTGAGCTVTNCTALSNMDDGIDVGPGSTVTACTASGSTGSLGTGIQAADGSTISGCTASSNADDGIHVSNNCQVLNNLCQGNGTATDDGAGIHVVGSHNRIDNNSVTSNDLGIWLTPGLNLMIRNSALNNSQAPYQGLGGNTYGELLGSPDGGEITECNPWANFRD